MTVTGLSPGGRYGEMRRGGAGTAGPSVVSPMLGLSLVDRRRPRSVQTKGFEGLNGLWIRAFQKSSSKETSPVTPTW
jgi:hypothetical protein